jgi:hypothetical protein
MKNRKLDMCEKNFLIPFRFHLAFTHGTSDENEKGKNSRLTMRNECSCFWEIFSAWYFLSTDTMNVFICHPAASCCLFLLKFIIQINWKTVGLDLI